MTPFSERLLQAARYAGVQDTQAGIARDLGKKRQTVNYWFTNDAARPDDVSDIASKWRVNAEWLRTGKGDMLAANDELPADERELLRNYRSATPKTRQLISTFARAARKAVVTMAAAIPPLLAAPQGEAANVLNYLACVLCQMLGINRRAIEVS